MSIEILKNVSNDGFENNPKKTNGRALLEKKQNKDHISDLNRLHL